MDTKITEKARRILDAYAQSPYSLQREAEFGDWLTDTRHGQEKDEALAALWERTSDDATVKRSSVQAALRKVKIRLDMPVRKHSRRRTTLLRIAAVACLALVLGGLTFMLYDRQPQEKVAELIEWSVSSGDSVRYCLLPDGSQVWLNSHSTLRYGHTPAGNPYVRLNGEAFFDVSPQGDSLFEVLTPALTVRVHGTEFNVKARADDPYTSVSLYKGSVKVAFGQSATFLDPGTMLVYAHDTGTVTLKPLQESQSDWRSGGLDFDNVPAADILRKIAEHYRVEMLIPANMPASDLISIRFEGSENLEDILYLLENLAGNFTHRSENGTIIIITNQF